MFVFTFVVSARFVGRDIVSCRSCERTHWSHGFVSHHSSWFFRSSPTFVLWIWQSVSVCVLSFFHVFSSWFNSFKNSMPCQSCDMENRPHLTARAWAKPRRALAVSHLKSQPCWSRRKTLLAQASAGQLDNNWTTIGWFCSDSGWDSFSAIPDDSRHDLLHLETRSGEGFAPWTRIKNLFFDGEN